MDQSIEEQWLQWILREHIPEVMATNCFLRFHVARMLDQDESEESTYSIQYFAESKDDYNRYIEHFADVLRKKSFEKWGDRFMAFRSVMEIVQ